MSESNYWHEVTDAFDRESGGERWIRNVDETCWISVLHRMTGFGYMEWETAFVFLHEVKDRPRTWQDRDCIIIIGDHRAELTRTPKEELRPWYDAHIDGNRNSCETLLFNLRKELECKDEMKAQLPDRLPPIQEAFDAVNKALGF